MQNKKNLWIFTEEKPREPVIKQILEIFSKRFKGKFSIKEIRIEPIIEGGKFTFLYSLKGVKSDLFKHVYIKIISAKGSFVDYLAFYQEKEPEPQIDDPFLALEETKVDIGESRNVTAYQRNTKFVYLRYFFKEKTEMGIYYSDFPSEKLNTTYSLKFGLRLLLTLGVDIYGIGNLKDYELKPFKDVDDLLKFKDEMPNPASGQKVELKKYRNKITLSIKLDKGSGVAKNRISHDPNVGQASSIIKCLRILGWEKKIEIINHHVIQSNLTNARSKLIAVVKKEDVSFEGLELPKTYIFPKIYWSKDVNSEKNGTIFLHVLLELNKDLEAIFDNHAGCERGYLYVPDKAPKPLPKTEFNIPDLIIRNKKKNIILEIEGEKYSNLRTGLKQIKTFDNIDTLLKSSFPDDKIVRTVTLYGDGKNITNEKDMSFILTKEGDFLTNRHTHSIIKEAKADYFTSTK